jgi:Putative quorum-sensing-regulated virulence factor
VAFSQATYQEASMLMPFGKYKGHALSTIPDDYLEWLRTRELREPLKHELEAEWQSRTVALTSGANSKDVALKIIALGYRALIQAHHPDHGGSTATAQTVNKMAEWLRRQVKATLR